MNLLILICILIILYIITIYALSCKDKKMINYIIILLNILTLITSLKIITINKYLILLNSITYMFMIYLYYNLVDKSSKNEIKNINKTLLITNLFIILFLSLTSLLNTSINNYNGLYINNIIRYNYRIIISYTLTSFLSFILINDIYNKLKLVYENKFLSYLITNTIIIAIELILYLFMSYFKIYDNIIIIQIFISTYMFRLILLLVNSLLLDKSNKKVKKW